MVGQRLVEALRERDTAGSWAVTVLAEERRPAYDRIRLSAFFDGVPEQELTFATPDGVDLRLGEPALAVDRTGRVVSTRDGGYGYDALVLATGSYPFVPPIDGAQRPGCFTYRTLDDLVAIREYATGKRTGAVIGGGLLGLEAANALRLLGLQTHIVEFAPRLMPLQVDEAGGATTAIRGGPDGAVRGLTLADGTWIPADIVVIAAGVRPRDELARAAGLAVGARGGVVVDEACRTEDSS